MLLVLSRHLQYNNNIHQAGAPQWEVRGGEVLPVMSVMSVGAGWSPSGVSGREEV